MKILLTGGTGYLGSLLAGRLTAAGHEVGCVVRDPGHLKRLEPLQDRVVLIPADETERGITGFAPDTVINTACTYARGSNTEEEIYQGNLAFPFRVLQAARKTGVRRWINTSTLLPPMLNSYALSKSQFAQWGKLYAKRGELQFVDLILEQYYGPNEPQGQFLSAMLAKMERNEPIDLTSGTQRRDFIYVDDVLDVFEAVVRSASDEKIVEVEVGTGQAPTIREVVEYLKKVSGSDSELRFGALPMRDGEPSSHCDTEMMRRLGIAKPLMWKDGLKCYVEASTHTHTHRRARRVTHDKPRLCAAFLCERREAA